MKLLNRLCCMQLHTATLVLGILGVIGASLQSLLCIFNLFQLDKYGDEIDPEFNGMIKAAKIQVSVQLVLLVISLLTSICLIMGAVKKNHLYLLPWLIQSVIGMFLLSIGFIFGLASFSSSFGYMLVFFMLCALSLYILMGVYSYYVQLRDGRIHNGQALNF